MAYMTTKVQIWNTTDTTFAAYRTRAVHAPASGGKQGDFLSVRKQNVTYISVALQ
jgi:hypothetical protein